MLPDARTEPYDTYELIASLVDADSFTEYKKGYGKTLVCGYARIDGWSVGVVANQRSLVKSKKDGLQFGGVIYSDSATERFIVNRLANGGFDQIAACQEDGARSFHNDALIAHDGEVGSTSHATAHHGSDLWNPCRGEARIVSEHAAEVFLVWENLVLHW